VFRFVRHPSIFSARMLFRSIQSQTTTAPPFLLPSHIWSQTRFRRRGRHSTHCYYRGVSKIVDCATPTRPQHDPSTIEWPYETLCRHPRHRPGYQPTNVPTPSLPTALFFHVVCHSLPSWYITYAFASHFFSLCLYLVTVSSAKPDIIDNTQHLQSTSNN
jgi:hypothetical protein